MKREECSVPFLVNIEMVWFFGSVTDSEQRRRELFSFLIAEKEENPKEENKKKMLKIALKHDSSC
jgi:hypothetical protein